MKDKMSINSNNQPPVEFTEYLHALLGEIIIKGESFGKFKKWLKKYCDEYEIEYLQIENNIEDFLELLDEYMKSPKEIIKKSMFRLSNPLFLTSEQVNSFIINYKKNPSITLTNKPHISNLTNKNADLFNSTENRSLWWDQLEDQWKRAFTELWLNKKSLKKPDDDILKEIFATKTMTIKGHGPYTHQGQENILSFKLTNLSGVQNLTNITELDCGNNQITSLTSIQNLVNIVRLDCYNNNLVDLEGIEELALLTNIDCSENEIRHLKGIENLISLSYLDFSDNKISSLEELKCNTCLTMLTCSNNKLSTLQGIEGLSDLEDLNCSDNQLTSIIEIINCQYLETIHCNSNRIKVLPSIGIESLTELDISDNEFHNLNSIENFRNLEYFTCNGNNLNSISGINKLNNLVSFRCSNIPTSSIQLFEDLLINAKGNKLIVNLINISNSINQMKTDILSLETLNNLEKRYKHVEIYYEHLIKTT